jgi:hypothetical protein
MAPTTDCPWDGISVAARKRLVWSLWFATWLGLLGGLFDRGFYDLVVWFSAAHAALFLYLFGFRPAPFPVQVRLAYLAWVAIGTYVPYMLVLLYITTLGLTTNLFLGYCPLARMLYLLPWNRAEPFSLELLARVFLTPPVDGRFTPLPRPS